MSWTLQGTNENQSDIDKLENAIVQAVRSNILLFCSVDDRGIHRGKCYPADCDSRKLFRIGAATTTGDGWKWVGEGQADFIFPGEQVPIERQHYPLLQESNAVSGSSIATALAAGLAALILYVVEVDNHHNLNHMQSYDRMEVVFKELGEGSVPYIQVWELFKTYIPFSDGKVEEGERKDVRKVFEWVSRQLRSISMLE
jgi:hypothetical protein